MNWTDQAACAGIDVDLWFPDKGERGNTPRSICYECPIRRDCLEAAIGEENTHARDGRYGIRGGLGPAERAKYAAGDELARHRLLTIPQFKCGHPKTYSNLHQRDAQNACRTCANRGQLAS